MNLRNWLQRKTEPTVKVRLGVRAKVLLVVGFFLLLRIGGMYTFVKNIVFTSYVKMENEDVRLNVERVASADRQLQDRLYEREYDWASWDDAYQFVQDRNQNFIRTNLGQRELRSNKLDFVAYVGPNASLVAAASTSRFPNQSKPEVTTIFRELGLNKTSGILKLAKRHSTTVFHEGLPLNVAVCEITKTDLSGKNVGWLIWGQYESPAEFRQLASDLKLSIANMTFSQAEKDNSYQRARLNQNKNQNYTSLPISDNAIFVYYTSYDDHGHPIWVQRITLPRNIYAQGVTMFNQLLSWLIVGSILFCLSLFLAIDWFFLRRLRKLTKVLSKSGDPSSVWISGNDELSDMAESFRSVLTNLGTRKSELKSLNDNLEETVRQRTNDLTQAIEEAERANAAKSEFLSHMSHELRTPLNAVIGFGQLIQMQTTDEKTLDSAAAILEGGQHLLGLITEILDFARIESGKLSLSMAPVSVEIIIRQAIALVQTSAHGNNIEVVMELPPHENAYVQANQQRLLQIVLNVMSNAVKYNRPGGRVEIRCGIHNLNNYRIEIEDTGHGIKEENLCRLFLPFERLGNQYTEGTGLGLALSRNLAHLMGGELHLIRTDSTGTTFALDLASASGLTNIDSDDSLLAS